MVASVIAWSGPADAAGGETGVLRIHGPGSVYAGSPTSVSLVTTEGGAVSFPFEVVNTGSSVAQFNFSVSAPASCGGTTGATSVVTAGSLIVTTLSQGKNGYFTAPINPGAAGLYTLKVTMPKIAAPNSCSFETIDLYDTAGEYLGEETAITQVKATTGTQVDDEFLNGAGQSSVSGEANDGYATSPTLAVGGTATFTVKLANDSTESAAIGWKLAEVHGCSEDFKVKVVTGSSDITASALEGTYSTPVLAPKASLTLTVTIKQTTYANSCTGYAQDYWTAVTNPNAGGQTSYLLVPLAP